MPQMLAFRSPSMPLQLERRVGFPNGDIGKVHLEYEGLNRFCFACKRISHDVYGCPNISHEEREKKIKVFRELNPLCAESNRLQNGSLGTNRNSNTNNKRPRSPSSDEYPRSPSHFRSQHPGSSKGDKRTKVSESYWNSRSLRDDKYPLAESYRKGSERRGDTKFDLTNKNGHRDTVWNRLEHHEQGRKVDYKTTQDNRRDRHRGQKTYKPKNCGTMKAFQQSQQVWRPSRHENDERSHNQSRSASLLKNMSQSSPEKTDSQQTISAVLPNRMAVGGQGSGVLVVHTNETSEERLRRLKGKAHMTAESKEKSPLHERKMPLPIGIIEVQW
ncbi:hypothetical protein Bca101_025908 [Brassica carinata]